MFNTGPKRKPRSDSAPPAESPAAVAPKDAINTKRDRESARSRLKSAASREIGPLPPPTDPERRARCKPDLELFCLTYFPAAFPLPFSPSHRRAIEKLQRAIIHGGLFAFAMPRGSGKTTLTVHAAAWALVYGYRRFVTLIGATEKHAEKLLENVKSAMTRETLAADFPEICLPLRALENDARRCTGQLVNGKKTAIQWTHKMVALPAVDASPASGSVVSIAGLTGAVRGLSHTLPNGEIVRPDLVIPDDPQTRASAWSDSQCESRLATINGDVLGLAGPGKKIAAVCPCTVIRRGDVADRLLSRKLYPDWQGERSKLLEKPPTNEKLWEEYWQIRADSLNADGNASAATDFYRKNRSAMDAGAAVSWPERYNQDELSAVQNAMNLKLYDALAFDAEYQNDPQEVKADVAQLKPEDLCTRLSHLPRGSVPTEASKLTAFVDVQGSLLFFAVAAWSDAEMAGWVLDYGAYPEQARRYYTLRQATPTLQTTFAGLTEEAAIHKGLESLVALLLARQWKRSDGATVGLDKILIDQGYKRNVVHHFIRSAAKGTLIMPAKGVPIAAANKPMSEYQRKPGEQLGHHWIIPKPVEAGELRHVRTDVNHWKTFVHSRLALAPGTKGAILLYGDKTQEHRLLADHLCAEFGTPTEGQGRQLVEWKLKPGATENHLFDCLVGCAAAASLVGCGKALQGGPPPKQRRPSHRKPVYMS